MNNKMKHRFKIIPSLVITIIILLITTTSVFAMTPVFSSGMLVLETDDTMSRTYTGYWSVICGVGTWYYREQSFIMNYCWYRKGQVYYDTLPYYGYTDVTSEKLANLIWNDYSLGLGYVSQQVVDQIKAALDLDYAAASLPKNFAELWDPFVNWQWRSAYMENRYAEDGNTEEIMANCWGTADYLTRSFKWVDAYPSNKAWALSYGISEWGATFPHIYLDGGPSISYSIDNDFYENSYRFYLKAAAPAEFNPPINIYLNSFDVIRMSDNPGYDNLVIDGINLGENLHCAAYLCTDAMGRHWFYEKGNFGATYYAPYGIRAFGVDPYWQYENCYRSLFQHNDYYKQNMAGSYDENWPGITP